MEREGGDVASCAEGGGEGDAVRVVGRELRIRDICTLENVVEYRQVMNERVRGFRKEKL